MLRIGVFRQRVRRRVRVERRCGHAPLPSAIWKQKYTGRRPLDRTEKK
jgi:hypothetical protein